MKKQIRNLVVGMAFFGLVIPQYSLARETGWITGYEWARIAKTLTAKGEMPVSLQCKDSGKVGLDNASGLGNVRIEKNPKNIAWYWAFGARYEQVKPRLAKDGYKLVSSCQFVRKPSNLVVKGGIWHKY